MVWDRFSKGISQRKRLISSSWDLWEPLNQGPLTPVDSFIYKKGFEDCFWTQVLEVFLFRYKLSYREKLFVSHLWDSHLSQAPLPKDRRFKVTHVGHLTFPQKQLSAAHSEMLSLKLFHFWVLSTCGNSWDWEGQHHQEMSWKLFPPAKPSHVLWPLFQEFGFSGKAGEAQKSRKRSLGKKLSSSAKAAPSDRSVRTPVVAQAPFQNNQPWAFLSSFQLQLYPPGKASNHKLKLPLMDNWPQASGEILQFLITLTSQDRLSWS